ncbi:MAG TPA: exopolysaccharide biosynthesis polyprenyl glycosylphosphotransferase, partial [Myxococcota bacterium]|nr:exopolysaccharide biosynthesis polyprenyl glycosylphosphotransferase [Myxococcota bacterium]
FLAHDSTANAIGLCETLGIDLTIPVDLFDTRAAYVIRRDVAGLPAISFSVHGRHARWQFALKRALDVAGALAALLITLPVWIAVAIAIKLDSPGPIFFVQPRCGRYGRPFPFLKFRTMVTDAEARKAALRKQNEKSGPVFKMQRDPRVTRVGRILRKYSLDELPQLLNVLAGHMSLVGPRPPVPSEVEKYELDHRGRLSMRPGITCLWQVSGRNEIEFEDWVKLDIEYVERWSLLLDLQILLATFPAVISGRGAS